MNEFFFDGRLISGGTTLVGSKQTALWKGIVELKRGYSEKIITDKIPMMAWGELAMHLAHVKSGCRLVGKGYLSLNDKGFVQAPTLSAVIPMDLELYDAEDQDVQAQAPRHPRPPGEEVPF